MSTECLKAEPRELYQNDFSLTKHCMYTSLDWICPQMYWRRLPRGVLTVSFSSPSCSTTSYQKTQEILWKKTTLPALIPPGCEAPAFNCPIDSSYVLGAPGQQNHLSCCPGCWHPSCSHHSCSRCSYPRRYSCSHHYCDCHRSRQWNAGFQCGDGCHRAGPPRAGKRHCGGPLLPRGAARRCSDRHRPLPGAGPRCADCSCCRCIVLWQRHRRRRHRHQERHRCCRCLLDYWCWHSWSCCCSPVLRRLGRWERYSDSRCWWNLEHPWLLRQLQSGCQDLQNFAVLNLLVLSSSSQH